MEIYASRSNGSTSVRKPPEYLLDEGYKLT
jgi:hypothetical protein